MNVRTLGILVGLVVLSVAFAGGAAADDRVDYSGDCGWSLNEPAADGPITHGPITQGPITQGPITQGPITVDTPITA